MDINDLNEDLLVLRGDGVYRLSLKADRVSIPDETISKALSAGWNMLPNACVAKNIPLTYGMRGKEVSVHGVLPNLRISSKYEIVKDKSHPCFSRGEKGIDMAYDWTPHPDMTLVFAVLGSMAGGKYIATGETQPWCYLLVADKTKKGWWRLPTSNVYNDGKICMGGAIKPGDSLDQLWLNAVNMFFASKFNSDLGEGATPEKIRPIFGWDMEEKQIDVAKDWTSCCTRVSATVYEHIKL